MTQANKPSTPDAGSAVFPLNLQNPPKRVAVAGDGSWVVDADGKRYLDASSGVFVAILGHDPRPVADAISEQARRLNFAFAGDFRSLAQEAFAKLLVSLAPPGMEKVWLTTSGSTANEAALKLARQYHVARGAKEKTKVISRKHSYHGSTIGTLSMTGSMPRRRPYEPYMLNFPKVSPPCCYRCPVNKTPATCATDCAEEIREAILLAGPDYVSAFIVEPVSGAPLGALPTPPAYLRRAREICDEFNVLLIVDEVVSAMGRTGEWFGVTESGVEPDIITMAKGLGGGFMPIGAVIAHGRVHDALQQAGASFVHGESFTGHVLMSTAGTAVIEFIRDHDLLQHARKMSQVLREVMDPLAELPHVGDVRGRGFIRGLELVADKATKQPFSRSLKFAERIAKATAQEGVLVLAGTAGVDGMNGDTIVIAPPLVTTEAEVRLIGEVLQRALIGVAQEMQS